ncbi:hypothetical protein DPEC_G00349370 [Dallia pectoralis]|uniref:Uncharacterized protein n=1 Tax=Dallia pectoralis TaxID=75939 RepID=A0ACC2F1F9_DALPE|nr:hypothetical protein DPEC_G00349370 [Dallia pectoralis]
MGEFRGVGGPRPAGGFSMLRLQLLLKSPDIPASRIALQAVGGAGAGGGVSVCDRGRCQDDVGAGQRQRSRRAVPLGHPHVSGPVGFWSESGGRGSRGCRVPPRPLSAASSSSSSLSATALTLPGSRLNPAAGREKR